MSAGVVIPGVSSSVILMTLGVYTTYLSAVANIDLSILFSMGLRNRRRDTNCKSGKSRTNCFNEITN